MLVSHLPPCLLLHFRVQAVDEARIDLIGTGDLGADVVGAQVGHQHAERGEHAGVGRDDHLFAAQLAHHGPGVHRTAAAKRDQHEVTRVVAAPHRDQLDGVHLAEVGQANHAQRRLFDAHAEVARDRLHRLGGFVHTDLQLPAQEIIGIQSSDQQVRVGDGRLVPPRS